MAFRRYSIRLASRLVVTLAAMFAVTWLALKPGYHSLTAIASAVLLLSAFELWRTVTRGNREISRFLDAARYADFSQRFSLGGMGSDFEELGQTFTDILDRQRKLRMEQAAGIRHLQALIEHIPVPLLTIHGDGSLTLQNNAARRLFGAAHVVRLQDLEQFGSSFHQAVSQAVPGTRELVKFSVDDVEYQLTMAATEIIVAGDIERLVSLQDIQTELDESQAQAWQDLVRVLTHEIMNSITPVTSLARTAKDVVDDLVEQSGPESPLAGDLGDLRDAVATVARRSDSLMQFVDSYRQITRLAPPSKKRIQLMDLFDAVARLAIAESPENETMLVHDVDPPGLDVHADRDLLEPVLLNLLRNARQATEELDVPQIRLMGRLNRRGHVVIEVRDNGPGVPDELTRRIFVPFFTTREGGSGVGLALARQVMISHGGFIRVDRNEGGGARFTLIF
jgi:nitrogen fixation/metabolism regulation signal transduction histidine kinase